MRSIILGRLFRQGVAGGSEVSGVAPLSRIELPITEGGETFNRLRHQTLSSFTVGLYLYL